MKKINDISHLRSDHAIDLSREDRVRPAVILPQDAIDLRDEDRTVLPLDALDLRDGQPNDFFEFMPAYVAEPVASPATNTTVGNDHARAKRLVLVGFAVAALGLAVLSAAVAIRIKANDIMLPAPATILGASTSPSQNTLPVTGNVQTPWPTGIVRPVTAPVVGGSGSSAATTFVPQAKATPQPTANPTPVSAPTPCMLSPLGICVSM